MHLYSAKQGEELVRAARNSIELFIINPYFNKKLVVDSLSQFSEKHGVFVTLEFYPTKALRGCIGFPTAVAPLNESIVDAAIAAAFEDGQDSCPSRRENWTISLSRSACYRNPNSSKAAAMIGSSPIKIGRDGLIVPTWHVQR